MKILTAFHPGGLYTEAHIDRLASQVEKYANYSLTVVEGEHPHWWCKMDLFKVEGPCLYFDLDMTIVGCLSPLIEEVYRNEFIVCRNPNKLGDVASYCMGWSGDVSQLYKGFHKGQINNYPGGDQVYIQDNYIGDITYFDDVLPNHIQSYKCEVRKRGIHPDCRVVAFHGNPRPWAIPELVKE